MKFEDIGLGKTYRIHGCSKPCLVIQKVENWDPVEHVLTRLVYVEGKPFGFFPNHFLNETDLISEAADRILVLCSGERFSWGDLSQDVQEHWVSIANKLKAEGWRGTE